MDVKMPADGVDDKQRERPDDQADSSVANQTKRFETGADDKQNGDKR